MKKFEMYLEDPQRVLSLEGEELEEVWSEVKSEYGRLDRQCGEAKLIVKAWEAPESDMIRTEEVRAKLDRMRDALEGQRLRIGDARESYMRKGCESSSGLLYGALDRLTDDWYGVGLDEVKWLDYPEWTSKEKMIERSKPMSAMEMLVRMMEEK